MAVAIAALTELSLTHLLLGFAVFQIGWGLYYGLPVSVEPMKALAALVIAGALTASELTVAGFLAGVVLIVVGWTGTLGLILLETGIQLSFDGLTLAVRHPAREARIELGRICTGHRALYSNYCLGYVMGIHSGPK